MAYGLHKGVSCVSGLGLGRGNGKGNLLLWVGPVGPGIHWVGRGHWTARDEIDYCNEK